MRGLRLHDVSPLHVAAYIRMHPGSVPTVKQHLAAIRMLGDWLVVSQILSVNPAAAVRGPKHVVTKGATPVLSPTEARDDEALRPDGRHGDGRRDRAYRDLNGPARFAGSGEFWAAKSSVRMTNVGAVVNGSEVQSGVVAQVEKAG